MPTYLTELDRPLIVEATRHTHAIWSGGRTLADHTAFTLAQLDLAGPEVLRYAGLVDDTGLVASLKRYGVSLAAPDGRALPAIGIGAVFTREDARRRGLAATLLKEALRDAREAGACAAWLHAEIDPAYYARLGFLELPGAAHSAQVTDLPASGALSLRPATQDDRDRLLAWYGASYPPGWLRPVRSPAQWRYFTFRNAVTLWILQDGDRDAGYLAASPSPRKPQLWVNEWAAPGVYLDRILATLRALAEQEGAITVAGWLRPDHAQLPFVASPRPTGVPMVALLAPPWTAASIDPTRVHFGSFDYF